MLAGGPSLIVQQSHSPPVWQSPGCLYESIPNRLGSRLTPSYSSSVHLPAQTPPSVVHLLHLLHLLLLVLLLTSSCAPPPAAHSPLQPCSPRFLPHPLNSLLRLPIADTSYPLLPHFVVILILFAVDRLAVLATAVHLILFVVAAAVVVIVVIVFIHLASASSPLLQLF